MNAWVTPEADMLTNNDSSDLLTHLFTSDDKEFCDVLGAIGWEEGNDIPDTIPHLY